MPLSPLASPDLEHLPNVGGFFGLISSNDSKCLILTEAPFLVVLPIFFKW